MAHLPAPNRSEDVPGLLRHYFNVAAKQLGIETKTVAPEAAERLLVYRWPGNVRELVNLCMRLSVLAPGNEIRMEDLPAQIVTAYSEDQRPWNGAL